MSDDICPDCRRQEDDLPTGAVRSGFRTHTRDCPQVAWLDQLVRPEPRPGGFVRSPGERDAERVRTLLVERVEALESRIRRIEATFGPIG